MNPMAVLRARKQYTVHARDRVLNLGSRTLIMGILNTTPDSFSDGGKYSTPAEAIVRAWQIADEGADLLDIGGESTRPGSDPVSAEEELKRVTPVLEALKGIYPLPISIDTSKAEVAESALRLGAAFVNDVTALKRDPAIGPVVVKYKAGVILMHMRGEPGNMQKIPPSPDIRHEIDVWAKEAVAAARGFGVTDDRIILDPGIGFGKTTDQNLDILRDLDDLTAMGFPILVGTSRKSFVGAILENKTGERIWGTAATVAASIMLGVHIVRVHDVAEMRDVAMITDALMSRGQTE